MVIVLAGASSKKSPLFFFENTHLFNMKTPLALALNIFLIGLSSCNTPSPQSNAPVELTEAEEQAYLERGKAMATQSFAVLSSQLQQALQKGGVEHAAAYCNTVAYPLVDSLSKANNAVIRRTSRKIRNPKDAPTELEAAMLGEYHARANAGAPLKPVVKPIDANTVAFYAPILMQALCLKCHGKLGETMAEEDYAIIKSLYPQDEAIGYAEGDLRGMWSITISDKQ